MVSHIQRRHFLKTLGLASCGSLLSHLAFASGEEWILGFGSCMDLRRSQSFWTALNSRPFNHFAFLGDNLYPERDTLEELQKSYEKLAHSEGLTELRRRVSVSAIWDDHDFGADNADSSLPFKVQSLSLFKGFWPQDYASETDGVHSCRYFSHQGRRIHLILLDTRYHRTAYGIAADNNPGDPFYEKLHSEPALLGSRQWEWLEEQLNAPADLKILCSSIQVLSADHRFEKWSNYPGEHERLLKCLARISSPTLLLSGDRHMHEISKTQLVSGRTLYDFTSSGFNKAEGLSRFERNRSRVQRNLGDGFGEVRIKWLDDAAIVTMSMIDKDGDTRFSLTDSLV